MTKKTHWIPLCISSLLMALLLAVAAVLGVIRAQGRTLTVGRFLKTDSGACFLVENGSAIGLVAPHGKDWFDTLTSGDEILLTHGEIQETYPAQTTVYSCVRLSHGSCDNIPAETLTQLNELGYTTDSAFSLTPDVPLEFKAQYIHSTSSFKGAKDYPTVRIIRSFPELIAYYDTLYPREDDIRDHSGVLLEAFNQYDGDYFDNHILILVLLESGSGSIRHEVTDVIRNGNNLTLAIDTRVPYFYTCDMAWWHVIIEPEAGTDVACAEDITVNINWKESRPLTGVRTVPTISKEQA